MHLIHKLRRSISHRPRHIFDLPDEILCLILEYCCQDLDFLLWSCPLVTLPDQFCHDCFHCTLCHGPISRTFDGLRQQHSRRSSSMRGSSSSSTISTRQCTPNPQDDASETEARGSVLRKRRRCQDSRAFCNGSNHALIVAGRDRHGDRTPVLTPRSQGFSSRSPQGLQPCPRNGNRPWCHHLQQPHLIRKPLLWRIVALFSPSLPPMSSLSYVHPPAKMAFSSLWQRVEGLSSYLTTPRDLNPYPEAERTEESPRTLFSISREFVHSTRSSAPRRPRTSIGRSSAFNASQGSSLHRRRTMSLSADAAESSAIPPMSRTQSSAGFTKGRSSEFPGQESDRNFLNTLSSDETDEDSEDEEDKDDFDDSVKLSGPFRNLLVSRRFADAAVQALWRNIVFHGHDMYQMQSLLSTLCQEDHLDLDAKWFGLRNVKEVDEEEEAEEEEGNDNGGMESQTTGSFGLTSRAPTTASERTPPWTSERQGSSRGWIESLNSSLKRFSGLQRLPDGHSLNTEPVTSTTPNGDRTAVFNGQRRHTMAGLHIAVNGLQAPNRQHGRNFSGSAAKVHGRISESRWPYRRHVRRVVLNFAHPQASSQMFVKVLECMGRRCPDQIQALDLHANEKMQDAGLGKTAELERLFGSGFTKLKYLRLQGGFVDNQLLYAIIKGCTSSSNSASRSDERCQGKVRVLPTYGGSPSLSTSPPLPAVVPCRLSHVFLGPGSITDSAVEKLIAAAGHSLEVFTVTSCVDVGGGALASLLTKCPRLRVLGVHRSLARDRDLLEGLGIEVEGPSSHQLPQQQQQQQQQQHPFHGVALFDGVGGPVLSPDLVGHLDMNNTRPPPPRLVRKKIVAPLERLELGTVKMTTVGVAEILKGTGNTLRFLVLETQHFTEEFLTDVIMLHCHSLEGLYFDDPECLQRQQRQMQGLGFSAGRRGPHLPNWHFKFGRSGRTFYSDPHRHYQPQQLQPQPQAQPQPQQPPSSFGHQTAYPGAEGMERHPSLRSASPPKVSAWLGETTTDEWVTYGDCALWSTAASPGISFENGGANPSSTGGVAGGMNMNNQYHRRQTQPLHHAYHNPTFMAAIAPSYLARPTSSATEFSDPLNHGAIHHPFMDEYDSVLERYRVTRETIENTLKTLIHLRGFTLMQMDFIVESQGLSEWKTLMRQEVIWVESAGFRALQLFYLFLFLGYIYFGMFAW